MNLKDISITWAVYTAIATFIGLAVYLPALRLGVFLLVTCYGFYIITDTCQAALKVKTNDNIPDWKEAFQRALAHNSLDIFCFVIAIFVGFFIGGGL